MRTLIFISTLLIMNATILFDFSNTSNIYNWRIVDDVVMGGRSNGSFEINEDGHGKFSGYVSLENNGGFSSLRYNFETKQATEFSKFVLYIKGDGKSYQFRVKQSSRDYVSYIYEFDTTADWMTVEIPFKDMYPGFRGRRLRQANFQGDVMEEIGFLIGNKKAQSFELLIDKIELQ
ncbi:Complex I intermediate-associated protein 30 (CIA30) [Formosa sp. Hel1_31_208]|uniref:CIA30 family protein n=1 Tax=Formosa sp. Hel1_31_208 TaxID=1798225 RepID=UPI00087DE822|nr:CIA30 family protein [Formosa sp. Hel1_31_208]SDS04140.1 Complex I intermediate-associated protein 30 (CIA30) [Formosa sp. Hel1_31_208]